MLGALVNLNHTGHYLHWGFIQISVANLVVIALMVVVFVAAVVDPVPNRWTAPMSAADIDTAPDPVDGAAPAARGRDGCGRPASGGRRSGTSLPGSFSPTASRAMWRHGSTSSAS